MWQIHTYALARKSLLTHVEGKKREIKDYRKREKPLCIHSRSMCYEFVKMRSTLFGSLGGCWILDVLELANQTCLYSLLIYLLIVSHCG